MPPPPTPGPAEVNPYAAPGAGPEPEAPKRPGAPSLVREGIVSLATSFVCFAAVYWYHGANAFPPGVRNKVLTVALGAGLSFALGLLARRRRSNR